MALMTLLTACTHGVALDWSGNSDVPKTQVTVIATIPVPTVAARSTPTASPVAIPHGSATPYPTQTLDDAALHARITRDERGRVIGGETFPVVNYSPTMITGKPCPRVTQWDFDIVKMPAPAHDYGISKDPCVVQNAVDDLARTLYFYPALQTPESMHEVDAVYDKDPMNVNGVERTLRQSWIDAYRSGNGVYHRCDKPVYRLILADAQTPLIANNDGRVSGRAMQIMVVRTASDGAPFACDIVGYKDGVVRGRFAIAAEDMRKQDGVKAHVYSLLWNPKIGHWQVYFVDVVTHL